MPRGRPAPPYQAVKERTDVEGKTAIESEVSKGAAGTYTPDAEGESNAMETPSQPRRNDVSKFDKQVAKFSQNLSPKGSQQTKIKAFHFAIRTTGLVAHWPVPIDNVSIDWVDHGYIVRSLSLVEAVNKKNSGQRSGDSGAKQLGNVAEGTVSSIVLKRS